MNYKYSITIIGQKRMYCGWCGKILIPPFTGDSCTMNHVGGYRIIQKVEE